MKLAAKLILPALVSVGAACGNAAQGADQGPSSTPDERADSISAEVQDELDSLRANSDSIPTPRGDEATRYSKLSDEDFEIVARQLGVEVAAIKAVVLIEAGSQMKGFYAPGVPVVNFDRTIYRQVAGKAPSKAGNKNAKVPSGLSGYALREWTQLVNARKTNEQGANMGTFWGMFQIGGFNYKKCGCSSVEEFVREMSDSEFAQLELFARFIQNAGMVDDLKAHNWRSFALKYNGKSAIRRGYHTKMANAYQRFKKST